MQRDEMISWLQDLGLEARFPVWFFSYNRAGVAPLLEDTRYWGKQDDIHIVVRESQLLDYAMEYPYAQLHTVPDELDCVGYSRMAALRYAHQAGHEAILLMDDDVLNPSFQFAGYIASGKNVGQECTKRSGKADLAHLPLLVENVLSGMSQVSRTVFAQHDRAVLGGAIKQHGAFGANNHRTMYALNAAVTPKQSTVAHVGRIAEFGMKLDVALFGRHGDDIGLIADILRKDGDCWAMPSFTYDVWSEEVNILRSVVRSPETAKALHAEEWAALQQYPIKDYLRVRRSLVDGSFEWADVNWQQCNKARGRPAHREPWPADALRDLV